MPFALVYCYTSVPDESSVESFLHLELHQATKLFVGCSDRRLLVCCDSILRSPKNRPTKTSISTIMMLRDQASRRRIELNPLTTAINVAQQYPHQTPQSALSQTSLSAQFGYNPSSFSPTPVSTVHQYNPQQWGSSPTPHSGGQLSGGRMQDPDGMVVFYLENGVFLVALRPDAGALHRTNICYSGCSRTASIFSTT